MRKCVGGEDTDHKRNHRHGKGLLSGVTGVKPYVQIYILSRFFLKIYNIIFIDVLLVCTVIFHLQFDHVRHFYPSFYP